MKFKGVISLILVLFSSVQVCLASQSGEEFVDPAGKFKISLMGDWRAVSYSDAVGRQKTEFVYRDRREGLLKISRENLSASLSDMVRREEEGLKVYRPGFERAASEQFGGSGALAGMRFSFYTTEGGRQTASTYYFLQDGNEVWVLRFSGKRGSLDSNRNVTDQMARSFRPM